MPPSDETRRHQQLPCASLDSALAVARVIEESAAGELSREVVARLLGVKPNTGGFTRRTAAAGYFGLVAGRTSLSVTALGQRALVDDPGGREARRAAVRGSSFGPLLERLKGRPARRDAIALLIRERLGTPASTADDASRALLASANEVGLIGADGTFDAIAIEGLDLASPPPPDAVAPGAQTRSPAAPAPATGSAAPEQEPAAVRSMPSPTSTSSTAAASSAPLLGRVELELRLSPQTIEVLSQLLAALRPGGAVA